MIVTETLVQVDVQNGISDRCRIGDAQKAAR